MRKPGPSLLEVYNAAGAFPIDDMEHQSPNGGAFTISTWVIHTESLPIVVGTKHNGRMVEPLIQELVRLGKAAKAWRPELIEGLDTDNVWTLQLIWSCTDASSAILEREIVPRTREEWALICAAYHFVRWFEPSEHHYEVFDADNLPEITDDYYVLGAENEDDRKRSAAPPVPKGMFNFNLDTLPPASAFQMTDGLERKSDPPPKPDNDFFVPPTSPGETFNPEEDVRFDDAEIEAIGWVPAADGEDEETVVEVEVDDTDPNEPDAVPDPDAEEGVIDRGE